MTIDEAYKKAIARKKEAVKQSAKQAKEKTDAEKKEVKQQTQDALLQIYVQRLRKEGAEGQALRASGVSGGAAKLKKEQITQSYTAQRQEKQSEGAQKLAAITHKQKEAESDEADKLAKLDGELYEKQASSAKNAQARALSMMRMGIYDASFASVLGVSDAQVRDYVKRKRA